MHKASHLSSETEICSCKKDLVLITKLSDTWQQFCCNECIFNANFISLPRSYCQCR